MKPSLRALSGVFARYGNLTFGGGNPTTAVLQQELVERRGWMGTAQFGLCYALSRVTPGTNLLAFCTAAAFLVRGWAGAGAALLAASIPCSGLAVVVTYLYQSWVRHPTVAIGVRGALAAAIGIMLVSCWQLARPYFGPGSRLQCLLIVGGAFVLAFYFGVPPFRVLLLAAVAGWMLPARPAA